MYNNIICYFGTGRWRTVPRRVVLYYYYYFRNTHRYSETRRQFPECAGVELLYRGYNTDRDRGIPVYNIEYNIYTISTISNQNTRVREISISIWFFFITIIGRRNNPGAKDIRSRTRARRTPVAYTVRLPAEHSSQLVIILL